MKSGQGFFSRNRTLERAGRLHGGHALLERLGGGAAVALERELHVLGGERVAVVELHALAQREVVDAPVGRHRPRLGQARAPSGCPASPWPSRRGCAYMTMNGVMMPWRLGRIEPRRGQRDVHAPRHLALGGGGGGRRRARAGRAGRRRRVGDGASSLSSSGTGLVMRARARKVASLSVNHPACQPLPPVWTPGAHCPDNGIQGPRDPSRDRLTEYEGRHGSAGAPRASGGFGGHLGAPDQEKNRSTSWSLRRRRPTRTRSRLP